MGARDEYRIVGLQCDGLVCWVGGRLLECIPDLLVVQANIGHEVRDHPDAIHDSDWLQCRRQRAFPERKLSFGKLLEHGGRCSLLLLLTGVGW